ncbi:hypothetical protein AB8992_08070 [Yersinia enterocolitica]|uniref:hypothetical protein n=1 Tax=Yersinia enterocolitica TaxID=630 RepID=UPI003D00CC54
MNNIEELKRFIYSATVTSGSGSQSFYIDAKSREEADARAANNESNGMYADDSEITDLDALEYEDETTVDDFGDFPLISREQSLIAQLEAAQKERDEFRLAFQQNEQAKQELFAQKDLLITANLNISRRAEKAEAELSAANEKLSKPVVLPEVVVVNISGKYPIEVMYASKVKTFIKAAGFTVEGAPAPVKYIVILQRAWCNDSSSGINYHSDLVEFDNRDKAIKHGFKLQDSDDFNIGVLTNGILTSFDWMAKPLAENKDSLARIASGIGIEGNADAE